VFLFHICATNQSSKAKEKKWSEQKFQNNFKKDLEDIERQRGLRETEIRKRKLEKIFDEKDLRKGSQNITKAKYTKRRVHVLTEE
jgi:hypothetical protein